VLEKNT